MTRKECLVETLKMLGGRAELKDIYPIALGMQDGLWKGNTPKATIRREIQQCKDIVPCTEQGRGWWQLLSYNDEVARLKEDIAIKDIQIADKDKEIDGLNLKIDELIKELGITPCFERLATALMNKLSNFDKDDKKAARDVMKQMAGWLALSLNTDISERINGFVYEKPNTHVIHDAIDKLFPPHTDHPIHTDDNLSKYQEIIAYVSRLQSKICEEWKDRYFMFWIELLKNTELFNFVIKTSDREFSTFNKYHVHSIVGVLKEAGAFLSTETDASLNKALEQREEPNKYRNRMSTGIGNDSIAKLIKQLVGRYKG